MSGKRFTNGKICLIVCNGQINKRSLLRLLNLPQFLDKLILIAADGASDYLYRWKVIPDYIIGDLDSITKNSLKFFKKKNVIIKKVTEQEHNDLEKCILFALSKNIRNIIVIGYGGKRIDHTLNNFSVLKRNYKKCRIRFMDEKFEIFFTAKDIQFDYKKGINLSLLGLPKAEGIITRGLKYVLNGETLEFGVREGALNKATGNLVGIRLDRGDLLVFKEHLGKISL